MPSVGEKWRFKRNRGSGSFTVSGVTDTRVRLTARYDGRSKTISLRTLRSDYEPY